MLLYLLTSGDYTVRVIVWTDTGQTVVSLFHIYNICSIVTICVLYFRNDRTEHYARSTVIWAQQVLQAMQPMVQTMHNSPLNL